MIKSLKHLKIAREAGKQFEFYSFCEEKWVAFDDFDKYTSQQMVFMIDKGRLRVKQVKS